MSNFSGFERGVFAGILIAVGANAGNWLITPMSHPDASTLRTIGVAGEVAAVLVSGSGRVYTGVCIDTACSLGFCAEHAAIAEMLKARESEITFVVAVSAKYGILLPCGRCRELMWQVDPRNRATRVIIGHGQVITLAELLPQPSGA